MIGFRWPEGCRFLDLRDNRLLEIGLQRVRAHMGQGKIKFAHAKTNEIGGRGRHGARGEGGESEREEGVSGSGFKAPRGSIGISAVFQVRVDAGFRFDLPNPDLKLNPDLNPDLNLNPE